MSPGTRSIAPKVFESFLKEGKSYLEMIGFSSCYINACTSLPSLGPEPIVQQVGG